MIKEIDASSEINTSIHVGAFEYLTEIIEGEIML